MISLKCPSCNGNLELPDNLDLAHCLYCGTKILLHDSDIPKDSQKIKKYRELWKTALETKNYDEAVDYCNKALELNPKDVDAWIDKGIATFELSSPTDNRYDIALGYFNKAAQISPHDVRINKAKVKVNYGQAQWLTKRGNEQFYRGNAEYSKLADIKYSQSKSRSLTPLEVENRNKAKEASSEYYIQAMRYYYQAYKCVPDNLAILSNIEMCKNYASWIEWDENVQKIIELKKTCLLYTSPSPRDRS